MADALCFDGCTRTVFASRSMSPLVGLIGGPGKVDVKCMLCCKRVDEPGERLEDTGPHPGSSSLG